MKLTLVREIDTLVGDQNFYISLGKTPIKNSGFLSGRTTKSVGRVNPPDH